MKTSGLGIRGLFRVSILIVVALASVALAIVSFTHVTAEERARAEASVRSEINYLCLQLESGADRAETFSQVTDSMDADAQELRQQDATDYKLLSDPVGDVLKGYTLAETGTVVIVAGETIVASDDARIPVGSDAKSLWRDRSY